MASYQVKVDLIFGEKGIVRGARNFVASFLCIKIIRAPESCLWRMPAGDSLKFRR